MELIRISKPFLCKCNPRFNLDFYKKLNFLNYINKATLYTTKAKQTSLKIIFLDLY